MIAKTFIRPLLLLTVTSLVVQGCAFRFGKKQEISEQQRVELTRLANERAARDELARISSNPEDGTLFSGVLPARDPVPDNENTLADTFPAQYRLEDDPVRLASAKTDITLSESAALPSVPAPMALSPQEEQALDNAIYIEGERRRPGRETTDKNLQVNPGAVAPPLREYSGGPGISVPDRWRLVEALGVNEKWWDPYNQNTLKGDRPIWGGDEWFFVASAISDTVIEPRSFPLPVGVQTTTNPGSIDVFGESESFVASQTFILGAALIKGSTAYKPQDLEFRLTAAFNYNYANVEETRVLYVEPSKGTDRSDGWIGIQEAFVDYHIRNVSERYDFDSLRAGIQPFNSDFRGFLFQDNQLGIRFFGNRDNNRFQYNLAAFARLEKDTNSGLNDVTKPIREDYFLVANAYRQDLPFPGMTSQVTLAYNINREKQDIQIDDNGFPVRPALLGNLRGRDYDVGYLGYNADGRIGRMNLTASTYYAFGENRNSIFTDEPTDIRAFFAAVEPSVDYNWMRFRLSGLYASGDDNPYDNKETGFDAVFENPQFAGADTSYWIRQTFPYAGGSRVIGLNGRNGILNSLRSSKEQGQSNFTNPGTILLGAGADFDVTPPLRISVNANHLWFDKTEVLEELRIQGDIDKEIGWDVSAAATYRPGFIQNFVFRLSGAALLPGEGFKDIYDNDDDEDYYYSVLFNGIVTY